jgi:NTP pyrophosphatase (non-canonical NTP hydrolase)
MNIDFETDLDQSEIERLAILAEECAEVQQIVSKILRHGYARYNPVNENITTNRELLEKELGDLKCAVMLMFRYGDISGGKINIACNNKQEAIEKYLHFNTFNS